MKDKNDSVFAQLWHDGISREELGDPEMLRLLREDAHDRIAGPHEDHMYSIEKQHALAARAASKKQHRG